MKRALCHGILGFLLWGATAGMRAEVAVERPPLQLLRVADVEVKDSFWAPRLRVYREKTIPHSWHYMQWELRALRYAAGERVDGILNGTWGEANLHKFLETIAYSLAQEPDPDLEQRADEIIVLLAKVQQDDGYLHVYVTNNGKTPWDPDFLDGSHDGYVLGHLIEAALEYHSATGKRAFLDVAIRAADQAWQHFLGPGGRPGFCGHAELEMALVELWRVTRDRRYLDLSRAFVEWRGRGVVEPAGPTPRAYFQDAVPLRSQRTLEGHAVRAVFFATGVADMAIETGDFDYRLAANRFWDSTTLRRMAITGSIGPRREHEAFGEDYELPQDGYYESCGACGLADFAHRMFLLEGKSESVDVLERVLYNAVLHGISLDGTSSYYQNPLSDRDNPRYNSWVCCPPNLSRTLMQIGRYAYAYTEQDLYINLFVGGSVRIPSVLGGGKLLVETSYPWGGRVDIRLDGDSARSLTLCVRRPGWCSQARIALNGAEMEVPVDDAGYWRIRRTWKTGDLLRVQFELPIERMVAHPNVGACRGRVAVQRGPLVYAFEGLDNDGSGRVILGADPGFRAESVPHLLGGITVIRASSREGGTVRAVPFFVLANRSQSTQEVWVEQQGWDPGQETWSGVLYRPLRLEERE